MEPEEKEIKQVFVKKISLLEKVGSLLGKIKLVVVIVGVILLIVGLLAGLFLARQKQDIQQHAAANTTPPDGMGMYDSCGTSCFSHLDMLHQAGFSLELDYIIFGWTSMSAVQAYAQHAQQDNIKIIWTLKDFYADVAKVATPSQSPEYAAIAQDCGCNDWTSLATYLVNQVKNDPATWGYYIADEPKSSSYNEVNALGNAIHQADPNHPRLIIKDDALENGNATNVKNNLPTFAHLAEVVGEDYYPVSFGQNIGATGNIAAAVQSVANSYGKNSTMVLEADSGNGTGILPSKTEMQEMLTLTLQNSQPRMVLWYWLYKLPSSQWNNLISVANSSSEYGTCGSSGQDVCTTNPNLGTIQYTDQVPGDICSINATNANDTRGAAVYCCNGGTAQYGTCGSSGQYKCTSSCSNSIYTGQSVSTQCGINATKAGLPRGTKIYCSCLGSSCPAATSSSPTDTPAVSPTDVPTSSPTNSPTDTPAPSPSLSPEPSTTPTNIVGDLNNDGVVDLLDYNLLMSCYGDKFNTSTCLVGNAADLSGDGVVDGVDYNILIRAMGGM
ncbi:MAG TPA: dockerin type I domain-containing protein [Candidatus Saccharimonadales bacterium]|nr:dockerin type I domain-containing protein [Candidatus Saccharimonadales bacterium]